MSMAKQLSLTISGKNYPRHLFFSVEIHSPGINVSEKRMLDTIRAIMHGICDEIVGNNDMGQQETTVKCFFY